MAITCLEVIFQLIFLFFSFLWWNLVCAYHSNEDYAECTKEYRRLAYIVPYAICVPPSRCKCVQTHGHTRHNKPLYISQLALGSLYYSMEDNLTLLFQYSVFSSTFKAFVCVVSGG